MSNIPLFFLLFLSFSLLHSATGSPVGVNYGRVADNLPPPSQVAQFLTSQTTIDKVKIFDCDPQILQAFAGTGISLTVTIPNSDIVSLTQLSTAQSWVSDNILPHYPQTNIRCIAVGNEVQYTGDKALMANLLRAMKSVHQALLLSNITDINVTSPHSLGILSLSNPPSSGRFRRGYDRVIFAPLLEFHRQTGSPFMVNPYPFFGFKANTLDFALFKPNDGVVDKGTGLKYFNMFDAMMDAVYSAMKRLGYEDVEIAVGETGWPAAGDASNEPAANLENAMLYNGNLVKHVSSGQGTPLMPNRTFETYIFALFNEDLKPSISEQNYGLFKPDFSPVYDAGVLKSSGEAQGPTSSGVAPSPLDSDEKWCVAKSDAGDEELQKNLDYVCSLGIDCKPIQDGGPCFQPNTVRAHASYAMNSYFQINGRNDFDCYFDATGLIVSTNPSYEACEYVA